MFRSENITKIAPALLAAQKLMGAAIKGSKNQYFKSSYADLGAVLEACKELLNQHGVVILQPHGRDDLGTYVETLLLHESGEFVASLTPVIFSKEGDPQAQGSAITYARRYGLQSLLSMPAEDDDGEKAMTRNKKNTPFQEKLESSVPKAVTETKVVPEISKVSQTGNPSDKTEVVSEKPRTTFRKPKNEETKEVQNGKTDDLGLN